MGSSKKHKKHKSERREKYEEYSNNMDPAQLQRGLKLILKVGANSTPEYSGSSPVTSGPPTAAEAMMSAAPGSPVPMEEGDDYEDGINDGGTSEYRSERHKKSKKKKKKKDREKKHKHHKEKHREKHRGERDRDRPSSSERVRAPKSEVPDGSAAASNTSQYGSPKASVEPIEGGADGDSSQDALSALLDDDDTSQPLPASASTSLPPESALLYASMTTENSPSCRPVTKPIVQRKIEEPLAETSAPALPQNATSPTKPLPELLIPSPGAGGGSSSSLTPKPQETTPKTPGSSSDSGREPRSCVLKLKQQKSPLNKLLDHLLRFLEKRDPHQFFAWPVTDDIAPGYSSIITKPMDFSTMRQRIEDHEYTTLVEFIDDFKLMCENAIHYNHVDTVYHKAAKRLLQVGLKHLTPENLMRSLKPLSGFMRELTAKELGFELHGTDFDQGCMGMGLGLSMSLTGGIDSADEGASTGAEEPTPAQLEADERRRTLRLAHEPKTRFEPFVDDLTSEEVLGQVQAAAQAAKERLLTSRERAHRMGFLRQQADGTTSLNILIKDDNEGPEKVVCLADLVGKLESGTGQLQAPWSGDTNNNNNNSRRNELRTVKPLSYGAFSTFAPVFDSRFSHLSMEETQLVLRTYGDATSAEYAESILQFSKDSSYASMLANGLLDILTNGEHSKAMQDLYDTQVQNFEQHEIQKCFTDVASHGIPYDTREKIAEDYEKYKNTRIDFGRLRTLSEIGIDCKFLDTIEADMKSFELTRRLQEHLSNNLCLIEKLRASQHDRLSQPLPSHLLHVPPPSVEESHIAQQITQQLSDLAKKLPPSAIADPYSLRRAMGVSYVGLPPPSAAQQSLDRLPVPEHLQQSPAPLLPTSTNDLHFAPSQNNEAPPSASSAECTSSAAVVSMEVDPVASSGGASTELEHELREYLESGSGTANTAGNGSGAAGVAGEVAQLLMN